MNTAQLLANKDFILESSTFSTNVLRRKAILADGTTLSIQASGTHYCEPRNSAGPWTHVEVGFPSQRIEST